MVVCEDNNERDRKWAVCHKDRTRLFTLSKYQEVFNKAFKDPQGPPRLLAPRVSVHAYHAGFQQLLLTPRSTIQTLP